jgi:hypothetical protein
MGLVVFKTSDHSSIWRHRLSPGFFRVKRKGRIFSALVVHVILPEKSREKAGVPSPLHLAPTAVGAAIGLVNALVFGCEDFRSTPLFRQCNMHAMPFRAGASAEISVCFHEVFFRELLNTHSLSFFSNHFNLRQDQLCAASLIHSSIAIFS